MCKPSRRYTLSPNSRPQFFAKATALSTKCEKTLPTLKDVTKTVGMGTNLHAAQRC
jgi:hypothetical protein